MYVLANLSKDGSRYGQEGSEPYQQQSQPPFPHKPYNEPSEKDCDPLDKEGQLVTNAVKNLLHVTALDREKHHYMWQSWVEIKHYSIAYIAHITTFQTL